MGVGKLSSLLWPPAAPPPPPVGAVGTRFYYDDNNYWDGGGSNPATPGYYSGWHETNTALRTSLKRGRPGNAFSQMTIQKNVAGFPKYGLARLYVSEPLPTSFVLSGTVRGQFLPQEQNAANDEMRALVIRVWNSTTNTFRSPAVLVHLPTSIASEFNNITTQNRFFPPEVAINPVNVLKGDRIVVEVGIAYFTNSSGAGVTGLLRTGNPASSNDLPEDESYTIPEAAAWLEFSMHFPVPMVSRSSEVTKFGGATSAGGLDYLFELIGPDGSRFDVTEAADLESLSRIQLTIERNLHDFRSGDMAVTFDDGDGFFSTLFNDLHPEDRWRLNVDRDHVRHFTGVIPGIDSVSFDRKQRLCTVTALDLSKLLEDVSAETVARPEDVYALGANIAVSNTTITLNSTAGLFNGDRISVTEEGTSEEFTISLITSGTVVEVTQAAANAFTAVGATVLLTSKFFRLKTPDFLVNALLDACGDLVSGRSVSAPAPFPGSPIFSEQSTGGLPSTAVPNAFLQKSAKHFVRVGSAVFDQLTPDANWASAGTDRQWIDWSPYRTQAEGEPATFATTTGSLEPEALGVDFTPGALVLYRVAINPGDSRQVILNKYTSADGITWAGPSLVSTLGDNLVLGLDMHFASGEYDPVRNRVYFAWDGDLGSQFGYWDVSGAARIVLDSSEARNVAANGNIRYSKEFDALVVYNSAQKAIEVWRGTSILYTYSGGLAASWSPKQTRYFNGVWYTVGYPLSIPTVLFSNDNFATVQEISLAPAPSSGGTTRHLTIVNGTIRVVVNANPDGGGAARARYFVAAGSEDWTINYADFSGQSVINALDDIAIILNAVFWMDTDGVAHFAPRSLGSGGQPKEIDDLVSERSDEPVWLELYDYVEMTLPGGTVAAAGQKTSTSRNLGVSVQLVDSETVALTIASYLLDFFSKRRQHTSVQMEDDGAVYGLLDVVSLDGVTWLVYAVDRDLASYSISLDLVEKVD
jgi:hypothetical protein